MGLTQIKSNSQSFVQPVLEGVVNVILDPMIDWIRVGQLVHIVDGGIYYVQSKSGFTYQVKLQTAAVPPGSTINITLVHPVGEKDGSAEWGGQNGKEW